MAPFHRGWPKVPWEIRQYIKAAYRKCGFFPSIPVLHFLESVFIRNVCGFSSIILLQTRQKCAGRLSPGKYFSRSMQHNLPKRHVHTLVKTGSSFAEKGFRIFLKRNLNIIHYNMEANFFQEKYPADFFQKPLDKTANIVYYIASELVYQKSRKGACK